MHISVDWVVLRIIHIILHRFFLLKPLHKIVVWKWCLWMELVSIELVADILTSRIFERCLKCLVTIELVDITLTSIIFERCLKCLVTIELVDIILTSWIFEMRCLKGLVTIELTEIILTSITLAMRCLKTCRRLVLLTGLLFYCFFCILIQIWFFKYLRYL